MKRLVANFRFGRDMRSFRQRVKGILDANPGISEVARRAGLADTDLDYIEREAAPFPTRDDWETSQRRRSRLRSEVLSVMNGAA